MGEGEILRTPSGFTARARRFVELVRWLHLLPKPLPPSWGERSFKIYTPKSPFSRFWEKGFVFHGKGLDRSFDNIEN